MLDKTLKISLICLAIFILAVLIIRLINSNFIFRIDRFNDIGNEPSKKIAFLFLVRNNLRRSDIWKKYLEGHESQYNIYCHAKEPVNVTDTLLKDNKIPEHIETCWGCSNLVEANLLMMREALKDPSNYKFILVSESCVPITSFQTMYNALIATDNSRIGIHNDNNSVDERYGTIKNPPFKKEEFVKHCGSGQVMNRHHAKLLVDSLDVLRSDWSNTIIPDEHYIGNTLLHLDGNFATKEIKNNENKKTTFDIWQICDLNTSDNNIDTVNDSNGLDDIKNISTIENKKKNSYINEFITDDYINMKKITNMGIDGMREWAFFFVRKVSENTEIDVDYLISK